MRLRAQQSCPALSKTDPGAVAAACSRSESAKITLALLPPSSSVTGLTWAAQPAATCLPTSVDPVKTILRTCSWVTNRSPTTDPRPGSTWKRCFGSPDSAAISPRRIAVSGVQSAGFNSTALPAASAGANPHDAIVIGKFHGTMTPTTPSGSWNVTSMPPATGICCPIIRSGAPE
jgi:hypothetical protein